MIEITIDSEMFVMKYPVSTTHNNITIPAIKYFIDGLKNSFTDIS